MDIQARLALIKQDFERLMSLCDPATTSQWRPTDAERVAYAQLLQRILDHIDAIHGAQKHAVLRDGAIQSYVSDPSLTFFRDVVEPQIDSLKRAYAVVDPDGAALNELLEGFGAPRGAGGRVRDTFEVAVQRMYDLIDNNPDIDYDFFPEKAVEVMDSKLIGFDPDGWLDRVGQLRPIRTNRRNVELPIHVRFRLEELFRSYVFGSWLSVLALSRAILEYAILDNLYKFGIDPVWPTLDKKGWRREKRLEDLIDDVTTFLPAVADKMHKIRELGNEYLHPKTSKVSKEMLFQREQAAKDAVESLITSVEALYLAKKSGA